MKKIKYIIPLALLLLAGCEQGSTLPEYVKNELNLLRDGFQVSGTVNFTHEYYSDAEHQQLISAKGPENETYSIEYTYQNDEDYVGLNREIYDTDKCVLNENVREDLDSGYTVLRVLDYNNTIIEMGLDQQVPYLLSGYSNPFLSIYNRDITNENGKLILNTSKTAYLFSNMLGYLDNAMFLSSNYGAEIKVKDSAFTGLSLNIGEYANEYNYREGSVYGKAYRLTYCVVNLTFSDKGKANAKEELKIEENKNYTALQQAFDIFDENLNFTMTSQSETKINGVAVEQSETIKLSFDGNSIYNQVWDSYHYTIEDAYNVVMAKKENTGDSLYWYTEDTTGKWIQSSEFSGVQGVFTYKDCLPYIYYVSANVFDYNESKDVYLAVQGVVESIGGDCFLSLVGPEQYASIYGTSVELRLNDDNKLDQVVMQFEFVNGFNHYTGKNTVKFTYGDANVPSVNGGNN